MFPEMDWSTFDPWELMTAMQTMSPEDKKIVGPQLDAMGLTKDVVAEMAATGAPMPGSVSPRQIYPEGPAIAGAPVNGLDMPPVPQTGVSTDLTGVPPGAVGGDITRPIQNPSSFIPPPSLGGLVYPTQAPNIPGGPAAAAPGTDIPKSPGATSPDGRTQAQRALAAQQGVKMPVEQKPMHQDLRQAPPPPKQGDVKTGATAVQMLLAAALSGGGPQGLRVPTLGALAQRRA